MAERKIPELLSPVGCIDSMYAAVNNGADAIYLGGKNFSARSSAKNFTMDELKFAIEYARLRNVKAYITINTLYKNSEIYDVLLFAQSMYKEGANAFILQDIGVANEIKKFMPNINIHASTQMNLHSLNGVRYIQKMGFNRVVLSRELSVLEINEINDNTNIETEVFVHGALCVSYSGQCLMSSIIGGRSGNRGRCAQTCRLTYDLLKKGQILKKGYLLSPKDIMTLQILEEIINSGVSSLKIEGRMKSPEYVAITTKAYREQLDKINYGETLVNKDTIKNVTQIFNRGGAFSKGYFKSHSNYEMMSTKTPKSTGRLVGKVLSYFNGRCNIQFNEDLVPGDGIEIWTSIQPNVGCSISKEIKKGQTYELNIEGNIEKENLVYKSYDKRLVDLGKKLYLSTKRQLNVQGYIDAKLGERLRLKISHNDVCIVKEGDVVEEAQNNPTTLEKILKQFSKTGNTPYKIEYNNFNIDDNIYISISHINELRRKAVEEFEQKLISSFKREITKTLELPQKKSETIQKQKLSVQIKNEEQLNAVIDKNIVRVYLHYNNDIIKNIDTIIKDCRSNNIEVYIYLPFISRSKLEHTLKDSLLKLEEKEVNGYLVSTLGQLEILYNIESKKKIMLNYNLNTFNDLTLNIYKSNGIEVTLSQELNLNQIKNINGAGCEIVIHGRQIVMATHQCPVGIYCGHKSHNEYCKLRYDAAGYSLLDKKGTKFPIVTDCNTCIAFILNSKTLVMYSKYEDIKDMNVEYLRLVFNDEEAREVSKTVSLYIDMLRGISITSQSEEATYGHFYRGVE